jgi:putative sterol carrier protein
VYELTEYGSQLESVLVPLGLWGAQSLGEPRPGEIITVDSMITALRTTFVPEAAHGQNVSYELRLGEVVLHARVEDGRVSVREGALPNADLTIEAGPGIKDLMSGALSPAEAVDGGTVRVSGDPALLERFVELFRIPTRPTPMAA